MAYSLVWYPNLVHFCYHGEVAAQDILQSNLSVYGDARFDNLRWQVASFAPECTFEGTSEAVRQIAHFDRAAAKSNPRIGVLLVGNAEIQESIFETYAENAIVGSWDVLAFATVEEAFAHAGVEFSQSAD